jgi:putative photosynthetic complex assembly protein
MTAHSHHDQPFPKGMLVLAGLLVGSTLLLATTMRLTGTPPQSSPVLERAAANVAMVKARDLSFADQADGSLRIIDASTGQTAGMVEPMSKSGFIRGVMRGLMRDRHMRGVRIEPPFRLTLWANGQISIMDTTSGRITDLSGFGDTNRAAFMELLK